MAQQPSSLCACESGVVLDSGHCDRCGLLVVVTMGDGGPCMSCGGNDGYGPAPHHASDCYFASSEDAAHAA